MIVFGKFKQKFLNYYKNGNSRSILAKKNIVKNVSFDVRAGEIVCIAGIDGNTD